MPPSNDHQTNKPVIFLAFAQDRVEGGAYLRNLPIELDGIRKALQKARQAGLCEIVERSNTTVENILDVFQEYQDRIAIFHYGGHADSYELLLESLSGEHAIARSEGLVSFLARQKGLQLVFLNGCSSRQQALDLTEAGVPAVIGTSQKINDAVATNLSGRFYRGLAAGLAIERAWAEAIDQINIETDTANFRGMHGEGIAEEEAETRLPWEIYYREGAEIVKNWNLPAAANQPLFGLPLPESYYRRLPAAPFIWLKDFKQEDAAIFFGRGAEIRKLHTHITAGSQPILLFYGKAGVGKSSLLQAGLMPRLENDYTIKYVRCLPGKSLTDTLTQSLQDIGDEYPVPAGPPLQSSGQDDLRLKLAELQKALGENSGFVRQVLENELQKLSARTAETLALADLWHRIEEKNGRPLLLVLDEIEKNLDDRAQNEAAPAEQLKIFSNLVQQVFAQAQTQPRGKLILSCREEVHGRLRESLQAQSLPFAEMFLAPLSWEGVVEAVEGVTRHPATQTQFHLEIDRNKSGNLPEIIAGDLLESEESPLAPMLQIVLTGLWRAALRENAKAPRLTVRQYQELKQAGGLVGEFFKQQIEQLNHWQRSVVESGLVLDLLYRHTTPSGTAESLSTEQLQKIYHGRHQTIEQLLDKCRDLYLLTDVPPRGTGLAHALLAPIVIKEYSNSVKPGQQAARILNSRIEEFRANAKGIWLNDADLEMVEKGREGMRQFDADEERLLQISRERKAQRERERKRNRVIRNVLAVCIFLFAVLAGWQWQVSERNYKRSKANQLAFIAKDLLKTDNTKALRVAEAAYAILGANSPAAVTRTLSEIFHSQELWPFYEASYSHDKHVTSAAIAPDGRRILTASEDGFAKLWNEHGNLLQAFDHEGYEVESAAFSPNGKQVMTLANGMVKLWEMNGKLVDSDTLPAGHAADLSDFSTDGMRILKTFAGSEDEKFRALIQRLKQGEETYQVIPAANQQRVATISSYGIAMLLDGEGNILRSIDSSVVAAAISPDGKRMLTVTVDSLSTIKFWDEQGNFLGDFKYRGEVNHAVFSPDGAQILTAANDHTAKLWDLSQKFVHRLPPHGLGVTAAGFSPDGRRIVTASHDGFARLWDEGGILLDSLAHGEVVNAAAFSPDGKRILTASRDGNARLWLFEEARVLNLPHRGEVQSAIFSPDEGSRILTAARDSTARLWTAGGSPLHAFRHHGEVMAAAFSSDGHQILTVSSDSAVTLWNASGDSIKVFKHHDEVNAAAFSPDGKQIFTACADSVARLWQTEKPFAAQSFKHGENVRMVAFSPASGKRLLVTAGNTVKLWNEQGNPLESLAHKYGVKAVAFSSDGQQILTASIDQSAKLWNVRGELLANFGKHTLPVNSANFSSDGKNIITASDDGYAIIWWASKTIFEWLKTAPVYRLTREEEERYEIIR
ncbi:AAA family ATPase [bacterium]|nr:AAA family ATPase [bacterium]